MAVPFIDLARMNKPLKEDMHRVLEECVNASDFILGAHLKTFEQNFADQMKSRHAIGVASGTDALMLSLHAIGVGPGDEVICPALSFVATAEVVVRLGATVIFVDVTDDYTIDVDSVRVAITERTKAIIPVHLYGRAAQCDQLAQIAQDYGIYMVEDCAQATGAVFQGRAVGTWGMAGCFSFYPTKNLGGYGDGGMIVTDSDELAARLRLFRDHGRDPEGRFLELGYNSRLDSIQAGMLDLKLPDLDEDNQERIANAEFYSSHLVQDAFVLPETLDDGSHVYNSYTLRHPARDEIRNFLSERGVATGLHYARPIHLQPCFEWMGYREGHFPKAEQFCREVFQLPVFPGLSRQELEEVAHTLNLYAKTHPSQS